MSQQDELDFEKPRWSLYQVVHWIAFRDRGAPADESAGDRWDEATVSLLDNWMAGAFKGSGRPSVDEDHEEIPSIKLGANPSDALRMFEPLSNKIYNSRNRLEEPMYLDVFFNRDDIRGVWPGRLNSPPETHSGLPGRPSPKHLYEAEFDRRVKSGEIEPSLRKQAEALHNWLRTEYPKLNPGSAKTIINNIRAAYRRAENQAKQNCMK